MLCDIKLFGLSTTYTRKLRKIWKINKTIKILLRFTTDRCTHTRDYYTIDIYLLGIGCNSRWWLCYTSSISTETLLVIYIISLIL